MTDDISPLHRALTQALRSLANPIFVERGRLYFNEGRVEGLKEDGSFASAKVRGAVIYHVQFWTDEDELCWTCTCPVGLEEEFCKHCAAVGLALLAGKAGTVDKRSRAKPTGEPKPGDLPSYLRGLDKKSLESLLLQRAREDEGLERRLRLKAAQAGAKGSDLGPYRKAVDEAIRHRGFVEYRQASEYCQGIEEAVDGIEALLKRDNVGIVIELVEYALRRVEGVMDSVDDSDGEVGDILQRLQEIHYKACVKSEPDPKALAKRLFEWEFNGERDIFHGSALLYAGVLGSKGLEEFQRLAEPVWSKVVALKAGDRDAEKYGKRFRITKIMESLARARRDVGALAAVMSRDLSSAYDYLQIAELYRQEEQAEQAIAWAEKGVKAFPKRTDSRLRLFLAEEYGRGHRHAEALKLMWADYVDSPGLQAYQTLKGFAAKAGEWTTWRRQALDLLFSLSAKQDGKVRAHWEQSMESSHLVAIFLWERDFDSAWRQAQSQGCSSQLWLELAKKLEVSRPKDAFPIYQRLIADTVVQGNNDAYRSAFGLLKSVRKLMAELELQADFGHYLKALRIEFKPKRNFMKLLDQAGWDNE